MKPFTALALALTLATPTLTLSVAPAFAQTAPNEIVGTWETGDGTLRFEMFDAGGTYAARVIYSQRLLEADGVTFMLDTHNPDPALRSRSLEGVVFLTDLTWNGAEQRWEGGNLYSPANGRMVSALVTLVDGNLELRAYIGMPSFGQTNVLHRVD